MPGRIRTDSVRTDILGLEAFLAIAERGSFRAAASHLNLSETALSHRIRKLEEAVSARLLTRTTRSVTLSPAGLALLPRARRIFDELGATLEELRAARIAGGERLAIGCLPTVAVACMPEALAAFSTRWPATQVRIHDNSAAEIAEKVRKGEAEFGVTIAGANSWDLDLKPAAREPFVLACPAGWTQAQATALTWDDIAELPLVRISAETGNRILIDDALGARREALSWRYEVQRVVSAIGLVRSGVACAVVPRLALDPADPAIIGVALRAPAVSRMLGFVTRKGFVLSEPAEALMPLVATSLRRTLGVAGKDI